MRVTIEGTEMVVRLPMEPYTSATGKSTVLASTHGNVQGAVTYNGEALAVSVGVNVYCKVPVTDLPKSKGKK